MRKHTHRHIIGAAIVAAGCSLLLSGCLGFGGGSKDSTPSTVGGIRVATTVASVADAVDQPIVVSPADRYSSFQSKDPFVQQQNETTDDTNDAPVTTTPASTTTTTTTTSTTSSTSTTSTSSTSSTTPTSSTSSTTSTTSFYAHMIQVLSVGVVEGSSAVTFQVDNNVYVDQHVGDKVSTSWGDVTVVGINTTTKVVTLLHDGETLTLAEHQILFE